jgi:serine/threonine protein kinase
VADFGLCMSSLSRTHGKRFMGTTPYAAPELYEGRVTTHTDQYALAVTYCELVSNGRVMRQDYRADPCEPPVDLRKLRTSESLVLVRALDPSWTGRFPSCKSFVAALREAVQRPKPSDRKFSSHHLVALRRPK